MGSGITTILDYFSYLGVIFVAFTLLSWPFYYLVRVFFSKILRVRFAYWPAIIWSLLPFLFLLADPSVTFLYCLPGLFIGVVSVSILEKLQRYFDKHKTFREAQNGFSNRDPTRFVGRFRGTSSKSSSSSSSSSSNRSDFGGGGFSGGGGNGKW